MPNNSYVTLSYDELNEKGLTPLTKAMEKAGYTVAKVVPAGVARRKDGIMTRTFTLIGLDEQIMDVQVNDTGDISGIKLNGKATPYKPVKTMQALGQALAALFNRGATAFQKALARKMARVAKKDLDKATKKPSVKSSTQQLADAKARRDAVRDDIAQVQERMDVVRRSTDDALKETESVQARLVSETAQTRQLREDIARLEEES